MKPSARAQQDVAALTALADTLGSSSFGVFGVRPQESKHKPGELPIESIAVMARTEYGVFEARRKLAAAVGTASPAWSRYGPPGVDLSEVAKLMDTDARFGPAWAYGIELAVTQALAQAEQAHAEAVAREGGCILQALAWWVRLPDEIAEAAGSSHEKAVRRLGLAARAVVALAPPGVIAAILLKLFG